MLARLELEVAHNCFTDEISILRSTTFCACPTDSKPRHVIKLFSTYFLFYFIYLLLIWHILILPIIHRLCIYCSVDTIIWINLDKLITTIKFSRPFTEENTQLSHFYEQQEGAIKSNQCKNFT